MKGYLEDTGAMLHVFLLQIQFLLVSKILFKFFSDHKISLIGLSIFVIKQSF